MDSAPPPPLLRADADGVRTLTLARPERRNTLSESLMAALAAEFDAAAGDPSVRVVVLAAQGAAFCAGHDMKEMTARRADADGGRACFTDLMRRCSALMQQIVHLPQPVIAAVEGVATAAGCQLVATCDLAVAGAAARFQTPGVDIGLFCSTPMVALSRNVGRKAAMAMLLTGEALDAEAALRHGLVNRVAPAGRALAEALDLARIVASKSTRAVSMGKRAFHRQAELPLADAYRLAGEVMVENMMTADAEEGLGAFLDKRDPVWRDL